MIIATKRAVSRFPIACLSDIEVLWIRIKLFFSLCLSRCLLPPAAYPSHIIQYFFVSRIGTVTRNFPYDHCFFVGDATYSEINWSTLTPRPDCANFPRCIELLSSISVFVIYQMITTATRHTAIPDLFLTSDPECVTSITIMISKVTTLWFMFKRHRNLTAPQIFLKKCLCFRVPISMG